MREIKFRAWDKIIKKFNQCDGNFNLLIDLNSQLQEVVLQQYTGLKDKNGKEIYEGDLLKLDENFRKATDATLDIVLVKYDEELGGFGYGRNILELPNTYLWMSTAERNAEIIGNMYENPERLKAE